MRKPSYRGFTLVELLVVIVIVVTLAGLTGTFLPKALKKGKQTKAVLGMQQMASAFQLYAKDHSNKIPPVVTPEEESEEKRPTPWVYYLEQISSNKSLDVYFKDKWWRENTTSIYINPLLPKKDLSAKSTGYAMNSALAMNIALSRGEKMDPEESKFVSINLNAIPNETATPIIIPHWGYSYVGDKKEMSDKRFEPFLVSDRIPVLFLDSHVDNLTPKEYVAKGLNLVPQSPADDEGGSN